MTYYVSHMLIGCLQNIECKTQYASRNYCESELREMGGGGVGVNTCLPTGGHLMNVLITSSAIIVIIIS